jgi:hypothetical protein
MLAKRQFNISLFEGTITDGYANPYIVSALNDPFNCKRIKSLGESSGFNKLIVTTGSFTIPLPKDYVNTYYCYVVIRSKDQVRVKTTSPAHAASTVLLWGSSTQPVCHVMVEKLNSLVIENPTADYANIDYCVIWLPDISLESNFADMQSTGAISV